jgi:hypothetical protein
MKRSTKASPGRLALRMSRCVSDVRKRLAAVGLAGLLALATGVVAAAVVPGSAAAFNNGCGFSQIGNSPSPFYTTNGYGTPNLYACDGLYVQCWVNMGGTWEEYVTWTSRYGSTLKGFVRDSDVQTFGNPPSRYWHQCSIS